MGDGCGPLPEQVTPLVTIHWSSAVNRAVHAGTSLPAAVQPETQFDEVVPQRAWSAQTWSQRLPTGTAPSEVTGGGGGGVGGTSSDAETSTEPASAAAS